jgi:hypothetical protein
MRYILLALLLAGCTRGCSWSYGGSSTVDTERQDTTYEALKECENTCPPGTRALVLKGGSGSEGSFWTCGCIQAAPKGWAD